MRVLIVGSWIADIYEKAFFDAFNKLGHEVHKFSWHQYFHNYTFHRFESDNNFFKSIYYRFQNKFIIGPAIIKMNKDLVKLCRESNPDLIFIYRGTHIWPETVRKIKKAGTIIIGYNNDDPFGKSAPKYEWRFFHKSLKLYDYNFVYRHKNLLDYKKLGCDDVSILRSYYINSKNYFNDMEKEYDIVYIGHFEDDGRDDLLLHLLNNNIDLKIFGTSWDKSKIYEQLKARLNYEIEPVYDAAYNDMINRSRIVLVFLSKLNNDTYTRRCFEIPVAKSFMLCEYTDDMDSMFKEGVEAEYFRNKEELLDKVKYYLRNESKREEIAEAGYERILNDGHEALDRVEQIIDTYNNIVV